MNTTKLFFCFILFFYWISSTAPSDRVYHFDWKKDGITTPILVFSCDTTCCDRFFLGMRPDNIFQLILLRDILWERR